MFKVKSQSGFTLMEIIVVMIILGIVAAIAAPNVFNQISRNRSQEAVANMSPLRQAVDACLAATAPANCNIPTTASANFNYAISGINSVAVSTGACPVSTDIVIRGAAGADAKAVNGAADNVALCRTAANTWRCVGAGLYQGVCQ